VKNNILETIRNTVGRGPNVISESTPLEDLLRDSLDVVELIAVLTDQYNLSIQPGEMNEMRTVGDIIRYVQSHQNQASRPALESF